MAGVNRGAAGASGLKLGSTGPLKSLNRSETRAAVAAQFGCPPIVCAFLAQENPFCSHPSASLALTGHAWATTWLRSVSDRLSGASPGSPLTESPAAQRGGAWRHARAQHRQKPACRHPTGGEEQPCNYAPLSAPPPPQPLCNRCRSLCASPVGLQQHSYVMLPAYRPGGGVR
jgi:hypothetical protein